MGSHAAALVFILALRVSSLASGSKLQPHMPNVCAEPEVLIVGQRQPRVQAFTRSVQVWKPDCGARRRCAGYERRTGYYTGYRQVYKVMYQTTYKCCPGWSQLGGDAGCLYPACGYGVCFNGGNCAEGSSQLCHCSSGFQGPRCQYANKPSVESGSPPLNPRAAGGPAW
ncbi:multiple epidermal growth factor-like domains protein 6 [Pezoporus flaviventris]|uniref:multiple epidermal growth factor-like domains protein 6 n=1 Tax=Pezoporus flaviventris TaxID=889875 RepID=UPI002AAFDC3F|nr:multiple epidermal growth factor-like domains protein 6 [Pezoporus flaviventris]